MIKLKFKAVFFILFIACLILPVFAKAQEALTWDACVKEALENNPDLMAAREEVVQSRADEDISRAGIFPQISGQLSGKKSKTAGSKKANTYAHSVSGQQLLFDGFKTASDINAAIKSFNAQEYNYMVVSSNIRLNLRIAFSALLKAQELICLTEEITKRRKENLELVQIRYEAGREHKGARTVGYDYGEMRAAIPKIGRWFTKEEISRRDKVAVIGITVAGKIFNEKNPIGKEIKINRINFQVIGIAPEKGSGGWHDQDDVVYIPLTTAMHRVLGKDYIDQIYAEVIDAGLMKDAREQIRSVIRKRHKLYKDDDSFEIRDMSEIQEMLNSTTQTMSLLLGCIAAISLLVGGIGIMNIMLVSVTERTREIGLRKAIGARRKDIMAQFLIEAVVMTFSGGLMGIGLGAGTAFVMAVVFGWAVKVSVFSIVLSAAFSIAIGIGFGLWPAKKAAYLNPIEALRYE